MRKRKIFSIFMVIFMIFMMTMCAFSWFFPNSGEWIDNWHSFSSNSFWIIACIIFSIIFFPIACYYFYRKHSWFSMCNWDWEKDNFSSKEKDRYIDILKTRLAKGEINEEEFDRLKVKFK